MKRKIWNWSLEVGMYPGIVGGIRTYNEKHFTEIVLYIPFVNVILTVYYVDDPDG